MAARKPTGSGQGGAAGATAEAGSADGGERRNGARRRRRAGGFGGGFGGFGDFGGGLGGGPFGMPPQFAQLMSMLMAMGGPAAFGGMGRGMGGLNFQLSLKLMSWLLETWLDYLDAMQGVIHRAFDRFQALGLSADDMMPAMWGEDGDDDDGTW